MSDQQRFVVVVEDREGLSRRVFGVFRSFRAAEREARAWGGTVSPLERLDAERPWDPKNK